MQPRRRCVLSVEQLVVIGCTAVLLRGPVRRCSATPSVGIAMQAASQNQLAAVLHGHPGGSALNALVWALAAAVAALRRHPAGADHLRARQHGLHRAEGVSRRRWWAASAACPAPSSAG
jgi:hypothetical protein